MGATPRDLTDMLIFARVVEATSFTGAARKLGLSKSVVSARVLGLEDRLGARLLHRTTRRLTLTDEGVRFFDRCARVAAEADEAVDAAAGAGAAVRGVLRLTAPEAFAQRHLVAPLAAFAARHPEARLDVSITDRIVDLMGEGFDLAVRISSRLAPSTLVARRLASDRVVLCASPDYLARRGTPATPAELVHHSCLRYSRIGPRDEWSFAGAGRKPLVIAVDGPLAMSSGQLLREAALAGLGITILPVSEIGDELVAGRLVTILDGALRDDELGVYAVHAYAQRPPARVRAFVDHLVAWFATPRWFDSRAERKRKYGRRSQ